MMLLLLCVLDLTVNGYKKEKNIYYVHCTHIHTLSDCCFRSFIASMCSCVISTHRIDVGKLHLHTVSISFASRHYRFDKYPFRTKTGTISLSVQMHNFIAHHIHVSLSVQLSSNLCFYTHRT